MVILFLLIPRLLPLPSLPVLLLHFFLLLLHLVLSTLRLLRSLLIRHRINPITNTLPTIGHRLQLIRSRKCHPHGRTRLVLANEGGTGMMIPPPLRNACSATWPPPPHRKAAADSIAGPSGDLPAEGRRVALSHSPWSERSPCAFAEKGWPLRKAVGTGESLEET